MEERITQTQNAVLALVSAALFHQPPELPEGTDYTAVLREAALQSVLPLAFSTAEPFLPQAEAQRWRYAVDRAMANTMRITWEHTKLHTWMTEQQIPYTVLKGPASGAYYPEPMLRMMGDVDFLVEKADCTRAGKVLEAEGFAAVPDDDEYHTAYCRTSDGAGGTRWELHWEIDGLPDSPVGDCLRRELADLIARSELHSGPDGVYRLPCRMHHGLILLTHTATHMINMGVGLRHLCDWAVYVSSFPEGAFSAMFTQRLKAAGLWRFARLLTLVCVKYLRCPAQSWAGTAEDDLLERIMADIFSGGNFGCKDAQRINQAKLMTNHSRGTVDDTKPLRQLIYRLNDKARIVMPATARHPALLPVGWVYVAGRQLVRIAAGTRPKLELGSMLEGAARRKEIYKQFRLFETEQID